MIAPPTPYRPSTAWPRWLVVVLCLSILALAFGGVAILVKTRPTAKKEAEDPIPPTVAIQTVQLGSLPIRMDLQGSVQAARKLVLQTEVGGRIVWHAPQLVPGGHVRADQALVRIDARDYRLALAQQRAQVKNQELALQIERGRKVVAEREWELFQKDRKPESKQPAEKNGSTPRLALREPHVRSAEVALRAARSGAARARLQLNRTTLSAPFNAFVQVESVELGQLVGPQSQLAVLIGTDAFWVQVSVPLDKLGFIQMPKGDKSGSSAQVWLDTGDGRIERRGQVIRLLGDLDPVGRMARVLIQIDDPLGIKATSSQRPAITAAVTARDDHSFAQAKQSVLPLLLGAYVHVQIEGTPLDRVAEIPRRGLQTDDRIFLLDADNKLQIEKIDTIWKNAQSVFVRGNIQSGDRLILTRLPTAVAGMKLRTTTASRNSTTAADSGE